MALSEQGIFQSRDGTPIYYESQGSGRPLLFCYGLLCQSRHWRYQLERFSKHYRIITFDYRGHQRSPAPENDQHLSVEWCAFDVQDLIRHLKLSEAVCFGHSLGVAVTSLAATLEPNVIKGVVLICGAVTNPFEHMFFSSRMNAVFKATYATYEIFPEIASNVWQRFTQRTWLSYLVASRLGFNPVLAKEEDVLLYMAGVNQTPASTFFKMMKNYTEWDGRSMLKTIQCPALVIAGQADYITPVYIQEEMARLLPKGKLERIPKGSHNAHMDLPEMVNKKIEKFLERAKYT